MNNAQLSVLQMPVLLHALLDFLKTVITVNLTPKLVQQVNSLMLQETNVLHVPQPAKHVQEILTNVVVAMIDLFLMDKLVNQNLHVQQDNIYQIQDVEPVLKNVELVLTHNNA